MGGTENAARRPRKLADFVIEELLEQFRQGVLQPGQRLPPENELAAELGVSRGTLREATMELSRRGYLDVRQGAGTFVTKPDPRAVLRPIKSLLLETPRLRSELLQFRRLLEPEVASLAAERATENDVRRLRELIDRQRRAGVRRAGANRADARFHRELARIAGNQLVLDFLDALHEILERHRYEGALDETVRQHEAIVEAVARRDPAAARRATAEHLDWVMAEASANEFFT